jgi:hypothetical protein
MCAATAGGAGHAGGDVRSRRTGRDAEVDGRRMFAVRSGGAVFSVMPADAAGKGVAMTAHRNRRSGRHIHGRRFSPARAACAAGMPRPTISATITSIRISPRICSARQGARTRRCWCRWSITPGSPSVLLTQRTHEHAHPFRPDRLSGRKDRPRGRNSGSCGCARMRGRDRDRSRAYRDRRAAADYMSGIRESAFRRSCRW